MRNIACFILFFLASAVCTGAYAEERLELEGATIVGNRDLPKVLYIVPWKLPNQGHIISRPITRQTSEDLTPLDRTGFQRFLELHSLRQGINQ